MATNSWKAKSKSKYADVMIFLQKKWNMNVNVSFTICTNVPGDFTLNVLSFTRTSSYPSETLHIHCCHHLGITTGVMAGTVTFLLHFKDDGRKRQVGIFFYHIYYVIFSFKVFPFK
jgi:hypothetical protein